MLPTVLCDIIEEYIAQIDQLESLPEVNAILKLAQKSDKFLVRVATVIIGIPQAVITEIIHCAEFNEPYLLEIIINPILVTNLNTCLMFAMKHDYATSSLFWLFIVREPNLYFGPYTAIFENSLLFKILNFVTMG